MVSKNLEIFNEAKNSFGYNPDLRSAFNDYFVGVVAGLLSEKQMRETVDLTVEIMRRYSVRGDRDDSLQGIG